MSNPLNTASRVDKKPALFVLSVKFDQKSCPDTSQINLKQNMAPNFTYKKK